MTISISRLVVSVFLVILVSLAVPLFAQQTEQTTKPATVNTADLRPGMWCRVTLETPLDVRCVFSLGVFGDHSGGYQGRDRPRHHLRIQE